MTSLLPMYPGNQQVYHSMPSYPIPTTFPGNPYRPQYPELPPVSWTVARTVSGLFPVSWSATRAISRLPPVSWSATRAISRLPPVSWSATRAISRLPPVSWSVAQGQYPGYPQYPGQSHKGEYPGYSQYPGQSPGQYPGYPYHGSVQVINDHNPGFQQPSNPLKPPVSDSTIQSTWRSKFPKLPTLILGIVQIVFAAIVFILEIASLAILASVRPTGVGIWSSMFFFTASILTIVLGKKA